MPIGTFPGVLYLEGTTTIEACLVLSFEGGHELFEFPQIVLIREVVINVMLVKSAPVHADDHSELWKEPVLDFFVYEGVDDLQEIHQAPGTLISLGGIVGVFVPQGQELPDAMLVPEVVEGLLNG